LSWTPLPISLYCETIIIAKPSFVSDYCPHSGNNNAMSLGVPVSFSEINNMTVLAEIAYEGGNLMPELSFGTHFFQDLVEGDIFYLAIFPQKGDVFFNTACFSQMPNLLTHFSPGSNKYTNIVKVYETDHEQLQIMCDIVSQKVVCFFT
jgi:hypothetical protein